MLLAKNKRRAFSSRRRGGVRQLNEYCQCAIKWRHSRNITYKAAHIGQASSVKMRRRRMPVGDAAARCGPRRFFKV